MPKEAVRDDYGFVAQVAWHADHTVQLATVATDVSTFVAWCREIVNRYDRAEKLQEGSGAMLELTEQMGIFWTPDRRQIQELIRQLKRARNSVHGADE